MKDALLDIVQHTHGLGNIDLVKIVGDENSTGISAINEDRSVILDATFHNPIPEFIGTFGMPNLNKLNIILNIPEYREDAKISITKQKDSSGLEVPSGIDFENKTGDFKNNYRFMLANVINDKLKTVKMRNGITWDIEIDPPVASIQKLKFQAQANSEETTFVAKTSSNNLEFYFGDRSSHAGDFVFFSGISGKITANHPWPIKVFIDILTLPGDKRMRFSNQGAAQITVDSGIAVYNYTIPALTK
jgi:hypothetical protein